MCVQLTCKARLPCACAIHLKLLAAYLCVGIFVRVIMIRVILKEIRQVTSENF